MHSTITGTKIALLLVGLFLFASELDARHAALEQCASTTPLDQVEEVCVGGQR